MKKLILIQPEVGFKGCSMWEPLGLGYLASYIHKHRPDIKIEVYSQVFDSDNVIIRACEDADYVGFGCTSSQLKNAQKLASDIKAINKNICTIFGGYHPSVDPYGVANMDYVDKVVVGEGENAMLHIVNECIVNNGVFDSEIINDLDSIPFPDRKLIKAERHVEVAQKETGERITSVQASRGCPFRCLPCSNIKVHGKTIRVRSPKKVVEEMKLVKEQLNLDFIKFCDATFNTSVERVIEFCKEVENKNLSWGCNIHPAIGNKKMFEYMKKAGCREIWIGTETGSPKILKELRKSVTVKRIEEVFKMTKEVGLLRRAYFLIGSPSETMEDIKMTEQLAEKIDADSYGFTILCPFIGTDLYDKEKYKDVAWEYADEYSNTFYRNKAFTNIQLKEIRDSLVDKFKNRLCWRLKKKN